MSKSSLFKKLSFILAIVMIVSSFSLPAMANPLYDYRTDESTGYVFCNYKEDELSEVKTIITQHYDGVYFECVDPVIPAIVYVGNIPYFVEAINDNAFINNTKLTGKLTINGAGERISKTYIIRVGKGAFYGCTGLTELNIGEYSKIYQNVGENVREFPFYGCTGLKKIESHNEEELDLSLFGLGDWYDIDNNKVEKLKDGIVYKNKRKEYTVKFYDWDYAEFKKNNKKEYKTISSDIVLDGDKARRTADPEEKEGFEFTGWYTDKACTKLYDFDKAVTANLDLYAGWDETMKDQFEDILNKKDGEPSFWFEVNDEANKTATIIRNPDNKKSKNTKLADPIEKDLVIPGKVKNVYGKEYTVTKIGDEAFFDLYQRHSGSLTIPEGVTYIGKQAFNEYSELTGPLDIPASVAEIGEDAFNGCSGFTSLSFGEGSELTKINNSTFYECSGMTGPLTIPEGVTSIGDLAFSNCGFDEELTMPEGVTDIGEGAFLNCNDLTGELTFGQGLKTIGRNAFGGTYLIGALKLPASLEELGAGAFADCAGFTSLDLGTGDYGFIYDGTFRGCYGFKGNLVIPSGVCYIDKYAFSGCSGFTGNLIIPDNVLALRGHAFSGCTGFGPWLVVGSGITTKEDFGDRDDISPSYITVFEGCTGIQAVQNKMALASIPLKSMLPDKDSYTWEGEGYNPIDGLLAPGGKAFRNDYTGSHEAPSSSPVDNTDAEQNVPTEITVVEKVSGETKLVITYPKKLPFFGNAKLKPEDLGDKFAVSVNGKEYKIAKMKVNKKKKLIQITKLTDADKAINKIIKTETKGDKGLPFETTLYYVGSGTEAKIKVKTKNDVTTVKSVKLMLFRKWYKAKKDEFGLSADGKYIEFKGNNLAGKKAI